MSRMFVYFGIRQDGRADVTQCVNRWPCSVNHCLTWMNNESILAQNMTQMRQSRSINMTVINRHDTWILMSVNTNFAVALRITLLHTHAEQTAPFQRTEYIKNRNVKSYFNKIPQILQNQVLHMSFIYFLFFIIWFVRLLALRPLLAYCASLGW
jgi:hypothetical protein